MKLTTKTLSPQQRRALKALAMFRFLTVSQFLTLGISTNETSLGEKTIRPLRLLKLIASKKMGMGLPAIHCLTKYGAAKLAETYQEPVENFPFPVAGVQFSDLYVKHRIAQVNFNIALQLWAHHREDTELVAADLDFVGNGSHRTGGFTPSTQVRLFRDPKPIIPDGVFSLKLENGHQPLYVLEVHRTTQTKAVSYQLQRYLKALEQGIISDKYGVTSAPFICSVHSLDNVFQGAKDFLLSQSDFSAFKPLFLFNKVENLARNFSDGWHFADGQPAYPFPKTSTKQDTPFIA